MEVTPFQRLLGWFLSSYAILIMRTGRYRVMGWERAEQVRASGRGRIYTAWHGMTMMTLGYLDARELGSRRILIVPEDKNGAILSIWVRRRKAIPFHISMHAESMVAARRLLELIRLINPDSALLINPDGPYGPSREPKAGVIYIAQRSGAVIVPCGAYTSTGYRIRRWDRYTVPFPWSRIALAIEEPLEVGRDADPEQARLELRRRLNAAEQAAEELYHSRDPSVTQL